MRLLRLGLIAALALPGLAFAQKVATWSETQALSRSAPTSASEGISLDNAEGFRVSISAPATRTISGGSLLCYFYSTALARWARCPTSMDLTPGTGVRDWSSADFESLVGGGRVLYATSSVTLSAGTTVTITIQVRQK